jgi:hypothetical protein
MKHLLLIATFFSMTTAFADQCAWNTKTDGKSALNFLSPGAEIVFWCQNCNEVKASVINIIDEVKIDTESNQVSIKAHQKSSGKKLFDGKFYGIDLAYTYARTATDIFANMAHLVGCPSDGATTFIQNKGNQKIPHYYDFNGVRKDGAPEVNKLAAADLEKAITKGKFRSPASVKK